MSNKYRIFNEKSRSSIRYPILFVFLALSLFVCVANRGAYGQQPTPTPIPDVGCIPNDTLNDKGCWADVFSTGPSVHATVLPNGHLLHWSSYSPHAFARAWRCNLDADAKLCQIHGTIEEWYTNTLPGPGKDSPLGMNVYCSGHSLMSNGLLLVTGGTHHNGNIFAELRTAIFDYDKMETGQQPWQIGSPMSKGRWYPTNVALGNGETLIASGLYMEAGVNAVNDIPEVYPAPPTSSPAPSPAPTPRLLTGAGAGCDKTPQEDPDCVTLPLYPWLYYASNGKVFYAGPTKESRWLNTTGLGSWDPRPTASPNPLDSSTYRESGSSVMYDVDKVLISGGGPVSPFATNEVIDLGASIPDWREVAPMAFARKHHNLTILADGKILATGGTKGIGFNNNCERQVVYEAEMWTPPTSPTDQGSWSTMAKMSYNRRYHSVAVLLRDGRVMVGGSDMYPSTPNQCFPPLPQVNQTQIFTPPYLFTDNGSLAARPNVRRVQGSVPTDVPIELSYGTSINIVMTDSTSIREVTFIRLSSVTHSFNMNQRISHHPVSQFGPNLSLTAPANSNVAPPGHYFMFVISSSGVPSVAKIVRIS